MTASQEGAKTTEFEPAPYKHTPLPTHTDTRRIRVLEVFPKCYRDLAHCKLVLKAASKHYQLCQDCVKLSNDELDTAEGLQGEHAELIHNSRSESWSCYSVDCSIGIVVKLYEVSLDTAPAFDALSYAWGSKSDVCEIFCDESPMLVTKSCHDALVRLRPSRELYESCKANERLRKLWIDAICIDQTSLQERSHQVNMMGEIYTRASRVWMWLGPISWTTVRHMNALKGSSSKGDARYMDEEGYKNLSEIFQRPYFHRIWPLQEIALAKTCHIIVDPFSEGEARYATKTDGLLFCKGKVYVSSKEGYLTFEEDSGLVVDDLLASFNQEPILFDERVRVQQIDSEAKLQPHRLLRTYFQVLQSQATGRRLEWIGTMPDGNIFGGVSDLLLATRHLQAGEHRDKIFALHGMLKLMLIPFAEPDYNKLLNDVYKDAAVSAIQYDQSLEILGGVTGSSTVEGLPSWVPDFSDSNAISRILNWSFGRASGEDCAQVDAAADDDRLRLRGIVVDCITAIKVTFGDARDTMNFELESLHPYEPQMIAFCQRFWESKNSPLLFLRSVIRRILRGTGSGALSRTLHHALTLARSYFEKHLDRKALFETSKQRVGFASKYVQVGDSVALLAGCNLPMVIRPAGSEWRVIAPAFVHGDGIMEGGLWKADTELQDFVFV